MIFYLNASKKTSKKQYLKTGEDRQKTENAGQFRPKKSGSAWTVIPKEMEQKNEKNGLLALNKGTDDKLMLLLFARTYPFKKSGRKNLGCQDTLRSLTTLYK